MTEADRAAWELARDSGNWRWLPGMALDSDRPGTRIVAVHSEGQLVDMYEWADLLVDVIAPVTVYEPQSDDPATLGAMLGLVRELWGEPSLYCGQDPYGWGVTTELLAGVASAVDDLNAVIGGHGYPTEFAALCHAIAAGPQRKEGE